MKMILGLFMGRAGKLNKCRFQRGREQAAYGRKVPQAIIARHARIIPVEEAVLEFQVDGRGQIGSSD